MAGPRGDLPAGIVTLVFTDIEGSTRLLHELGDAYVSLLDEHNRRIREVVEAHGGTEVKTEGDAFFLAFADPGDAVAACVHMQHRLADGGWPAGKAPLVRVGAHIGPVTVIEDADYVGLAVHEAARIAGAAHGGQVLVSDEVARAIGPDLPDAVTLLDLGSHVLRDFPRARRLFQIGHPQLRPDFPPLRTPARRRRAGLPAPQTELVGRQAELSHLTRLLAGPARLVTLTGPGGAGKTRLAIEAAWATRNRFAAGAWFVDLAAVTDAVGLLGAVLRTTGAQDRGGDVVEAICEHIEGGPALLVLDNLEQLLPDVVPVARLLEGAPDLTILATSRERLRLRAEHDVAIAGLSEDAAVELLRTRADAVGASLDDEPSDRAEAICRHLGGMPLAIELAAPQLRHRSAESLLRELRASLDVLAEAAPDAPQRHRALRATIAWSWDLLDGDQRRLLASLAVVAGSADLRLVEALAAAAGVERRTEELVDSLLDKSLLHPADGKPDEPRLGIQEVIRQFAAEQLAADPEAARAATDAHVSWCCDLAARARPHLRGREQAPWLDRLDLDHENLRLALGRSSGDRRLQLAEALVGWWSSRGHWTEARHALAQVLTEPTDDRVLHGRVLAASGYFAERQGDLPSARAAAEAALALAREEADKALEARALNTLGDVDRTAGRPEEARGTYEAAVVAATAAADHEQASVAASNLGVQAWAQSELIDARRYWEDALAIQRTHVGNPRSIAILTGNLGLVHRGEGRLDEAEDCFATALAMARDLGDPIPTADALLNLGTIAKDSGDEEKARLRYLEALEIYEGLGHRRSVASAFLHLALATDDLGQARRWASRAGDLAEEVGDPQLQADAANVLAALDAIEAERNDAIGAASS